MGSAPMETLATAIRAYGKDREDALDTAPESPDTILARHAEREMFLTATIAPPIPSIRRAIEEYQRDSADDTMDDEGVCAYFAGRLRLQLLSFSFAPERWDDKHSGRFLDQLARVFGVESADSPGLVRTYHGLTEDIRFGVLVAIRRSKMFDYVTREMLSLPPGFDREIEEPDDALRILLRTFRRTR